MINLANEQLVQLRFVPFVVGGRTNHLTVWRWRAKGVRGAKLEEVVLNGMKFTSIEALKRFFVAAGMRPRKFRMQETKL
jgi:hypothetical protein